MTHKLQIQDSFQDIILKMSEGNPGGLTALIEYIKAHGANSFTTMCLKLDSMGIYGTDIYILWSDKCNRDIKVLKALIDNTIQGAIHESRLLMLAKDQRNEVNFTNEERSQIGI